MTASTNITETEQNENSVHLTYANQLRIEDNLENERALPYVNGHERHFHNP